MTGRRMCGGQGVEREPALLLNLRQSHRIVVPVGLGVPWCGIELGAARLISSFVVCHGAVPIPKRQGGNSPGLAVLARARGAQSGMSWRSLLVGDLWQGGEGGEIRTHARQPLS